MDWQIKSIARKSALSERPFDPGDRVACLIYKDVEAGEIGRADVHIDEVDDYASPENILGRWTRVVKDPSEAGVSARETVASAEDFFFSLFEGDETVVNEETRTLKHLLGLMLERKRILKVVGARATSGEQAYVHAKTKREFTVPLLDMSPELMFKIQDTLGDIIL